MMGGVSDVDTSAARKGGRFMATDDQTVDEIVERIVDVLDGVPCATATYALEKLRVELTEHAVVCSKKKPCGE